MWKSFFNKRSPEPIATEQGYDLWSAHYAMEKNPIKEASDRFITERLPDLNGRSFIDAGCGTGYFCRWAEQKGATEITGIDFSQGMLSKAGEICSRAKFIRAEIQSFHATNKSDVLVCALVLGHLDLLDPVLNCFATNLKPAGLLFITDFHPSLSLNGDKRTFQSGKKTFELPHYVHPRQTYEKTLGQAGFQIDEVSDLTWKGKSVVLGIKASKKVNGHSA